MIRPGTVCLVLTSDIPVPPFADPVTAAQFHELLAHHARHLEGARTVEVTTTTLYAAIARHVPTLELQCAACLTDYPCAVTLSAVATCRMPVPWTPLTLAAVLLAAGVWPAGLAQPGRLVWGSPPSKAVRDPDGSWTVRNGTAHALADGFDDGELCTWLLADVRRFSLPDGLTVPDHWPAEIEPDEVAPAPVPPERDADLGTWLPGFS